jgi:hypothetical protein
MTTRLASALASLNIDDLREHKKKTLRMTA